MEKPDPFEWNKHLEETGIVKTDEMSNGEFYGESTLSGFHKIVKDSYGRLKKVRVDALKDRITEELWDSPGVSTIPTNQSENKTDLERFKDLYSSFGIDLSLNICEISGSDSIIRITLCDSDLRSDDKLTFSMMFDGFETCNSTIEFTIEGKFIKQGFWDE